MIIIKLLGDCKGTKKTKKDEPPTEQTSQNDLLATLYSFSFTPSRTLIKKKEIHEDIKMGKCREVDALTFVKCFYLPNPEHKKEESQTIKNASEATIAEVSEFKTSDTFETDSKDLTEYKIQYKKLSPQAYPYFPNFPSLLREFQKQKKSDVINFSLDMKGYFEEAEVVTFTKELERAQFFYGELKSKLACKHQKGECDEKNTDSKCMGLEVKHEYGKCNNEKNTDSKCGRSKIDIVLQRSEATRREQGVKYTAGVVIELKTKTPKDNNPGQWTRAHSQTAYEMLKLGTDMAIKDKLKQGEQVDVVIVYGILVYMDTVEGVVMELQLDFTQQPPLLRQSSQPKCITVDERGRIPLEHAFQLVMGKLIPDDEPAPRSQPPQLPPPPPLPVSPPPRSQQPTTTKTRRNTKMN